MVDIGGCMKTTLTRKEYKEFNIYVDYLKSKHDIDIPHTVEKIGDKFLVEMLDDIDVNKLDNLLDIDDDLLYNATQ
jgi:aromatic ring-opening dioxygenase LigB subunit